MVSQLFKYVNGTPDFSKLNLARGYVNRLLVQHFLVVIKCTFFTLSSKVSLNIIFTFIDEYNMDFDHVLILLFIKRGVH